MFQYITASNYYISLLWGVLMETQVVVAYFSAPPKFFSGSATGCRCGGQHSRRRRHIPHAIQPAGARRESMLPGAGAADGVPWPTLGVVLASADLALKQTFCTLRQDANASSTGPAAAASACPAETRTSNMKQRYT